MDTDAIAFGTDGWRARRDAFTPARVRAVAQAVADHLADEGLTGKPVAVGYDPREDSRDIAEELARVLAANGHDVLVPERDCPTPLVAFGIVDRDLAGAFMVTASHNPPEYNGVKFIPADGAPALPTVTDAIEANLREPEPLPESEWGSVREIDLVEPHAEHVLALVEADLDGRTIAYDAIHGAGRGVTDRLLEQAGATVERRRCERDPTFGDGAPEPSPETLSDLVATVQNGDANLGIANDGDADRIAVVTPRRGYLDENLLFAALYDYLLEEESGTAIRTVSTTGLIDRIADAAGEEIVEVPVGFKWVARAMADHDALIGGEESGGFSIRGHVREKDGVLVALLTAVADAEEPLDDRVDRLLDTHGEIHQGRRSLPCPDEEKQGVLRALATNRPDEVAGTPVEGVNEDDGVKLALADGSWLLARPSGTEPKMRVYAEAKTDGRVAELLNAGERLVEDARRRAEA